MPIFMDRHDVSESVTAEVIAQLHQQDIKVQHQFGCRGLTYWFDEKRKTAFCLIEADCIEAIHEMHHHAHGQVPHSIIEVDATIVESFLGRIEDPEKAQNAELNIINDPAFRTIMIIVQKGLDPKYNDAGFELLLTNYNNSILKIINSHEGSMVKQTDDQFLVSFKSVSNAVNAAIEIQSKFRTFREGTQDDKMLLKIGLNAGIPVTKKQLIFEDTIKLAERMCEIVQGEVIVSTEVRDLYKGENANSFVKGKNIFILSREDEDFLNRLLDFIELNWTNVNLKVDDFIKPMGCSKSQLYRKIISLTGESLNTVVKEYRLTRALKLLNKNSGNISEIAFETGFSSPSYFSKCFQKRYGHLPSDYLPVNVV